MGRDTEYKRYIQGRHPREEDCQAQSGVKQKQWLQKEREDALWTNGARQEVAPGGLGGVRSYWEFGVIPVASLKTGF